LGQDFVEGVPEDIRAQQVWRKGVQSDRKRIPREASEQNAEKSDSNYRQPSQRKTELLEN